MDQHLILWPVLAQIFLTLVMYLFLAHVKRREIAAGNVDLVKTALDQSAWPESVIKINNNLRNQFETPILFYVLCIILWALGGVDSAVLIMAVLYVACRCAHAAIHTTGNVVKYRFTVFLISVLILTGILAMTARALLTL